MSVKIWKIPDDGSAEYETISKLAIEVKEPSYQGVLNWMTAMDGRPVSYDFWQRGNYMRRLLKQRSQKITPIYVKVSYVDEIRWAYRRLALLGLPMDFIYCGPRQTGWAVHMVPLDYVVDAGWGYGLFPIKNPRVLACAGQAQLLPESALDWLVEEASEDFLKGRICIAPAELIGIDSTSFRVGVDCLSGLTGGIPLMPQEQVAKALMDLELPYLDRMSAGAFSTFLKEHEGDLGPFREAFQALVSTDSESEDDAVDHARAVEHEVDELLKAKKYERTRKAVSLLQGTLLTAPASMVVAQDPTDPIRWTAPLGTAAATLLDLWRQAKEPTPTRPFSLLWDLGLKRPSRVRRKQRIEYAEGAPLGQEPDGPYHWLCPPRVGARVIVPANAGQKDPG